MGPTVVVGPDGGEIEFPEGMDDAAINAAMLQIYPPAAPRAAAPARQPAAAPQRPADPGYPETYNPAPGLIATTPGAPASDEARILAISKGYSASPLRRSPGQFFMDAAQDAMSRASPQALLRYLTRNLTDTEQVDPATGERFTMSGLGDQLRRAELERRDRYTLQEQADRWNAPDLNWFERALRGGAGIAGAFGGSAISDPINYIGAPGVGSTIGATARNVAINAGVGAGADALAQGLDIGSGVQDQFNTQQMLASGALNAFLPTAIEGAAAGVNRMLPQPAAPAPARGGPAVPRNPAAQRASQQAAPEVRIDPETGRPYVTTASVDITPAEADALVAAGTHRRDPATGGVYRYVGATDQAPAASLPDVEVTAARPERTTVPVQGDAPAAASAAQPPIVRHRETAAIVEAAAPPVAEGMTRLWRGNRVGEDGKGLAFTNDLPGIALPFREAYGGNLTYIDVPSARLAEYESKAGAAPGAEFQLPADLAATARVAALEAPAPRVLAEDVGAPGRAPDEVLLGPVVRGLDDEFGIPAQPSRAVARAAEADLTLRAPAADRADPDLVGNIRLSNLNSEQDIARVLETARAAGGDFVEARRGVQSFADIEALAADLDMTADTLLKRRGGQAFNAEEITAARGLLVASAERVDDIARRIDEAVEPGDALNAEFHEAILRHVAIQEQVAGISAEAGRALGAMRMLANSDNITPEMLASVLGGGMDVKGAARAIRQAGTRNPKARARAIKAAIKPTFTDMLVEYWYNSILSGPATHIVNVLSNTLTILNQLPEFAFAAALGGAKKLTGIQWGAGRDRVLGTEVGQRAVGMVSGAVEGARAFADTLATGNISDGVSKIEVAQQRAIPGVAGTIIRTPGRFLAAEDEFFKATARRMQINGLATRIAHQAGLRGEAAVARAAELSANPTKEMMEEANNYARYITFQDPMGPIGRGVMQVTSAVPILKLVVPFVRTPINLMKQTVERSPFAFVLKSWREDVKAGGARADLALAKAAVGTGYGLAIALAAQQGNITGAAPTDRAEREALLATGWQPFSLKIGDNYYSYRRLDPLGTLVGIAATMGQPHLFAGEREGAEKRFVVGFLAMLSDKTFMSGISDLVAAVDDPSGRRAEAYINRLMGSVLVPVAVSQTAKALDPTSRVAENIPDVVRSRVPGMSQDLPARYDVLGRESRTSPGGFEAFSPVTRSPVRDDPVANMILDSGVRITPPNRTIKGTRLSAEVYSQYQAEAGAQIRNNMAWYTENPQVWNSMSQEERADETKRQVDRARETARQNLGL